MKFISKINTIFTSEFLDEMFDLYKQHKFYITNNKGEQVRVDDVRHMKSLKFRELLSNYFKDKDIPFAFLGDGTNRMCFLVDGYVFKLALDDQGYIDNLTEFKMSREAQPYVTKTYETNGLFCVAEYVTLISYDEFVKQKSRILEILDILSTEYLLGDMGWTKKNYCNWGYRKNSKDLVILDYGHMLKIDQNKLICHECGGFLSYNSTYTEIQCLSCGKKMDFMAMKSKISKKEEIEMLDGYLNRSVSTEEAQVEIEDDKFEQVHVEEEESDELISNRFVGFQREERRRFSNMMDDDEEVDTEVEEEYDYDYALSLLNNNDSKPKKVKKDIEIPSNLMKVQDIKLRGLLMMDKDDAEYSLGQELALGKLNMNDYSYYMSKIEEYDQIEEDEETQEPECISTIEEVVKVTKLRNEPEVNNEPEEDEDINYYDEMVKQLQQETKPEPVIEEVVNEVEENDEEENENIDKMNQMMKKLLYADDEGDELYPEDFIAANMANLGFDEEDSEEDEQAYDRILANIKRGNHVDMDELEDMLDEEDESEVQEEAYYATLEVIDPNNITEEVAEEENDQPSFDVDHAQLLVEEVKEVFEEAIIKEDQSEVVEEQKEPEKFVFKVQRNTQATQMSINNEEKFEVKRSNVENQGLIVNDIEDNKEEIDATEALANAMLRYNAEKNNEE